MPNVPGVQIRTVLGLFLESPDKKCHSDVASAESYKKLLYGARWWLPPSPGRGESNESSVARGLS
jgi:hypothetical protein